MTNLLLLIIILLLGYLVYMLKEKTGEKKYYQHWLG